MKKYLIAGLLVAGLVTPALAASEFYVAQDATSHKCKVVGKKPPIDLTDPKTTFPEALGWAIVLAIVVETARFGVTRSARQRSALEAAAAESD